MCVSLLPRMQSNKFNRLDVLKSYLISRHNSTASNLAMNSLNSYNTDGISESFNQISWTNDTIRQFETAVRNARHYPVCLFDVSLMTAWLPSAYQY